MSGPGRDELFVELRPQLLGLAYRMLSSAADAEDVVQDAFVRWTTADSESVSSPRAFLSTVVTRLCIDRLTSARAKRETYPGQWLPEPVPSTEGELGPADPAEATAMADSLSLAFLVLLEELGPLERAVFLLHEVFGYPFAEVADMTGQSAANCRQLASRARRRVAERRRRFDADARQAQQLAQRFAMACGTGDVEGLMAMLADDVVVWTDGGGKAKAAPRPVVGPYRAARFLLHAARSGVAGSVTEVVRLNGQPGLVLSSDERVHTAVVLDVVDGRICGVRVVVNPEKLGAVQPGARRFTAVP
ncbi:MAG TPA: RNA polymerase sigma-70 factor [Acidimicrobiales bacterium]|nr:RNA polymerase sigma-70 factor [Acidimicrobiales bacterium]